MPQVPQVPQSSSEPGQRTDVLDCLGKAPVRKTIHPRRKLGPVNSTTDTTSGNSRSETTSTSREERRPDKSSLMWSRPIPSPSHVYKQDLILKLNLQMVKFAADAMKMRNGARLSVNGLDSIVAVDWFVAVDSIVAVDLILKLNLQMVKFAADAMKMLNGARLSVNGLDSIVTVDWLIAAGINFSSTTFLRFADLEGQLSNNIMGTVNARPVQNVRMNHSEGNREERPGRFLMTTEPIGQHVEMFEQVRAPPSHVKERAYPKQVA